MNDDTLNGARRVRKSTQLRKFVECREAPGRYQVGGLVSDDDIIDQARTILAGRVVPGRCLESARDARDYLMHEIGSLDHEVFGAIFLDHRHAVLAVETLFRGSVSGVEVRLREVARRALVHNASALIGFHNHPSGDVTPSRMDEILTARLKAALDLIDVRFLDHLVIGAGATVRVPEYGRKTPRGKGSRAHRAERAP